VYVYAHKWLKRYIILKSSLLIKYQLSLSVKISSMQLKAISIARSWTIKIEKVRIPSRHTTNAGFAKTINQWQRDTFPFVVVWREWKLVTSTYRNLYLRTLNGFAGDVTHNNVITRCVRNLNELFKRAQNRRKRQSNLIPTIFLHFHSCKKTKKD